MAQTSIQDAPDAARAGNIGDTRDRTCVGRVIETAGAGVGYGLFVKAGTLDNQIKALAATGDVTGGALEGVIVLDAAVVPTGLDQYDVVSVMRKGPIWVPCETAMAKGAIPYVRFAGSGTIGAVRNDADTANAVQPPNGCVRVLQAASGAGLCLVELNIP